MAIVLASATRFIRSMSTKSSASMEGSTSDDAFDIFSKVVNAACTLLPLVSSSSDAIAFMTTLTTSPWSFVSLSNRCA
eukprot:scaffold368598_cov37-Attheya_sp.AAC.1